MPLSRLIPAAVPLLACAALLAACRVSYEPPPETAFAPGAPLRAAPAGQAWLVFVPRQCLSNPWEKEWGIEFPDGSYPHDPDTPGPDPAEVLIMEAYYARLGAQILETIPVANNSPRCAACSCPADYTLYVLVRDDDVALLLEQGFKPASAEATGGYAPHSHTEEDSTAGE